MGRRARRHLIAAGVLGVLLVGGLTLNRVGRAAAPRQQVHLAADSPPGPGNGAAGPVDQRRDRSPDGARVAALQFAAGVQQDVVYQSDAEARTVLASWMARGVDRAELDRTAAGLEETRKALLASGGQAWWVVSPLAAKVGSFTAERAKVSVWLVRVLASGRAGSGGYVPTSGWLTADVDLVWEGDRGWSVWSTSSTPGPVPGPTVTDRPATSEEFVTALDGFSLVKEHR